MQIGSNQLLEQAVVQWMNKLDIVTHKMKSFGDFSDGIIFIQLLNAVDPSFFTMELAKQVLLEDRQNPMLNHKHLIDIQNKIVSYRQNIQCKTDPFYVDIDQISRYSNIPQILAFFESVLRVVLSSPLKGQVIKPILELNEQNQEALMHFLKKLLDPEEEDTNIENRDEFNNNSNQFSSIIQKTEELENENVKLQTKVLELQNDLYDQKETTRYLQQLLDSKELELQHLMERFYEERSAERHKEDSLQTTHDQIEQDKLKQKVLQQEHRISELELILEDHKQKEIVIKQLKEENDTYRIQLIHMNQLKGKIDKLKETGDSEKEKQERLIERKDKELANLKTNIGNILSELSHEKEKSLNFELELQRRQAQVEKLQQDMQRLEQECEEKIMDRDKLIQSLSKANEQHDEKYLQTEENLESDLFLKLDSSKNDNLQTEFYKKENQKLENRLKQLQQELNTCQLELENKKKSREIENQNMLSQQINLLQQKLDKSIEVNNKLKKQTEDLKKQNDELKKANVNKKPSFLESDISFLSLLNNGLQDHLQKQAQKKAHKA